MKSLLRDTLFLLICADILILASKSDNVINVVWMAPLNLVDDGYRATFNASTSLSGLALAISKVKHEQILPGMKFNVTWLDSNCFAKTSIGALAMVLRDLNNLPDVIIGPPCTLAMQVVADMASYFNIPVFGWMSSDHRLDNKSRVTTLIRVMPPLSDLGNLLIYVCGRFKWNQVAMISSDGPIIEAVSDFFKSMLVEEELFYLVRHYSGVKRTSSDKDIIRRLRRIKSEARIIFLVIPEWELRRYMLYAHDLGMTGGDFQFMYVLPTISDNDEMDKMRSKESWQKGDGRDKDAEQAYRCLLMVTYSFILRWSLNFTEAVMLTDDMFDDYRNDMPPVAEPDRYVRFLHDAFYLFCLAYNHTVAINLTTTGDNIFKAASKIRFYGLTGDVHMNNNSDRLPFFLIWDLAPDSTFRVAAQIKYDAFSNGTVFLNYTEINNIYWGDGRTLFGGYTPPDVPPCGFNNELCPEDNTLEIVLPIVICTLAAVGVVVFTFVFKLVYFYIVIKYGGKRSKRCTGRTGVLNGQTFLLPNKRRREGLSGSQDSSSHGSSINSFDRARLEDKRQAKAQHQQQQQQQQQQHHHHQQQPHSTQKDLAAAARDKADMTSFSANLSVAPSSSINTSSAGTSYAESVRHFSQTAYIRGNLVAIRMIRKRNIKLDRRVLEDMQKLNIIRHSNLALFYGACIDPPNLCVLWEYCAKGSIQDIIQNKDVRLDSMFQFSMAMDIIVGLQFLHNSELAVHGNLRSSNCLVDSRWTCKLGGFGMRNMLRGEVPPDNQDDNTRYSKLFWTAPENLRQVLRGDRRQFTQPADMYSLAVVLKEILCKNTPYEDELNMLNMTPRDIVLKVAQADGETYFRPMIGDLPGEYQSVMKSYVRLIQGCWAEEPALRPTSRRVLKLMKRMNPFQTTGIMDNMLKMMEKYSSRLEDVVAERTAQLAEEKRKTDSLLYRMLPQKVADGLKSGRHVQAELFPSVTVYFSDIVGFTQLASESTPMQIIDLLNMLYTVFDNAIQEFEVYKVETIGDAYMVVSGLPVSNGLRHATIMADMSLSLLRGVLNFTIPYQPGKQLRVRIGLNTGPVVAGVVGNIMPRYCLFGDTVNLASRMESHGLPLKIQMSQWTYEAIEDKSAYIITERGEIEVKGKGWLKTYWLEGKVDVDEGPIDVYRKTRNPSTVNLYNFRMDDALGRSSVKSSSPEMQRDERVHGASDHRGPNGSKSGIKIREEAKDSEVEPELFEKEATGINILKQFSSVKPKLNKVDESNVVH